MKKLLSLIIASVIGASVCATPASAEFEVTTENNIRIKWAGNEATKDFFDLQQRLCGSALVSRKIEGKLVARSVCYGDPTNTAHWPAVMLYHVGKTFVAGRAGEIELNTDAANFLPDGCQYGSVFSITLYCLGQFDWTIAAVDEHCPGYEGWLMRSC
ncbi:MAG: hypothetical protein LBJ95_01745 [Oscillospiraceae bacterium]|jgi:hypothetical protein|nr:hypothetical protein [Oscillospiraceae bacterium]